MKFLIVTQRWRAGPGTFDSVTIPIVINTFAEWGRGEAQVVLNDVAYAQKQDVAQVIRDAHAAHGADVIVYTPVPHPAYTKVNVPPEAMRVPGAKVVSIFFDLADTAARAGSEPYAAMSDVCVNVDGDERPIGRRFLSLWPVACQRPPQPKDIGITFIGDATMPDRAEALAYLERQGIPVFRPTNLTGEQYFEVLDRSLVCLNFSKNPLGAVQIKGRVFEALGSHCCLVEDANPVTARYFKPGEVAYWSNLGELADKLRGFLSEPARAAQVAATGHAAFLARYSASAFWDQIVAAL
jgi:Glycosyl transferases group 1